MGILFLYHWMTGSGLPPSDEQVRRNISPSLAMSFEGVILGGPGETGNASN